MKVIGLGEILWRISSPNHLLFSQTTKLESQFGGSELNVLGGLASLGYETAMVTALPDNAIGQTCEQFVAQHRINTKYVLHRGERLGLYFYERGFSVRQSRITYDRKGSAFSELCFEDFDWQAIFQDADWFHVSGITVALNQNCHELALKAMEIAKAKGLGISFDLNYRATLWSSFQEAREAFAPFVALADICIGLEPIDLPGDNGEDIKDRLGLKRPYKNKAILLEAVKTLAECYDLKRIAFTQRELQNNMYHLKGFLYSDGKLYETTVQETYAVDRVGTGDAFTAGIIYGHLEQLDNQALLETAMASFVYKHTIEGDINLMTRAQLASLLESGDQEINR